MNKDAVVSARIESSLKHKVDNILDHLGITPAEAMRMFYKRIVIDKGIPFELKIPNAKTRKVIENADKGINLHKAKSIDDFFKDI